MDRFDVRKVNEFKMDKYLYEHTILLLNQLLKEIEYKTPNIALEEARERSTLLLAKAYADIEATHGELMRKIDKKYTNDLIENENDYKETVATYYKQLKDDLWK